MPKEKYTVTDARIARAFANELVAQPTAIGRLMWINAHTIDYLIKHKKGVPPDTPDSARQLLLWYLEQRLPPPPQQSDDLIAAERKMIFSELQTLFDRADELSAIRNGGTG